MRPWIPQLRLLAPVDALLLRRMAMASLMTKMIIPMTWMTSSTSLRSASAGPLANKVLHYIWTVLSPLL